jgi:hypothetical protein
LYSLNWFSESSAIPIKVRNEIRETSFTNSS